jgi:glyoxylase-like metal-dependent hydrolase (beta-lactamase superfamily II)
MQIFSLPEGEFTVDKSKNFLPYDPAKDDIKKRSAGSLLVEVNPFLVVTSKDVVLLDTGLGFKTGEEPQLYHNLRAIGIQPAQVTKVLLSHLHKDHAGGVCFLNRVGQYEPSFLQAQYYVQRNGLFRAMEKGFPSYMVDELSALEKKANLVLLQGNGFIDGYIEYQMTAAHTTSHTVYWLREAGETIFFGGDDAPQVSQMKNKMVAKYDYDGKKGMILRQKWWKDGQSEGWKFLFYHDVNKE